MKKLVSFILCAAMLLCVPVMASNTQSNNLSPKKTDDVITSVFFASDAQFYQSFTRQLFGNNTLTSCQPVVARLISLAKEGGHDIETFVFGGDYTQNESSLDMTDEKNKEIFGSTRGWHYGNNPKYTLAYIKETINNYFSPGSDNIIFLQGNHEPDITDDKDYGLSPMGAYEFDDYIVYVLNDQDAAGPRPRCQDISSEIAIDSDTNLPTVSKIENPTELVAANAKTLNTYLKNLIKSGDTRPVFIASHQPLYSERYSDYNGNAKLIFDAINGPAEELDIIFFFGHTHQKVDNIGGGLSYVAKGDTLKVCNNPNLGSSDTLTYYNGQLNFTYMNFGHLARYSGTNEVLSSTVIDITKDNLILTRYRGKDESTAAKDCVLATYTIPRVNPAETIPSKITGTVDANGETKVLSVGENVTISKDGVLKNATIDATNGFVDFGGLILTGKINFNQNGKISVNKGNTIKIVDGTTNTFLQKKTLTTDNDSYTMTITNYQSGLSDEITFNFDPIYEGDVMFRAIITNVPEDATLSASYK